MGVKEGLRRNSIFKDIKIVKLSIVQVSLLIVLEAKERTLEGVDWQDIEL